MIDPISGAYCASAANRLKIVNSIETLGEVERHLTATELQKSVRNALLEVRGALTAVATLAEVLREIRESEPVDRARAEAHLDLIRQVKLSSKKAGVGRVLSALEAEALHLVEGLRADNDCDGTPEPDPECLGGCGYDFFGDMRCLTCGRLCPGLVDDAPPSTDNDCDGEQVATARALIEQARALAERITDGEFCGLCTPRSVYSDDIKALQAFRVDAARFLRGER